MIHHENVPWLYIFALYASHHFRFENNDICVALKVNIDISQYMQFQGMFHIYFLILPQAFVHVQ